MAAETDWEFAQPFHTSQFPTPEHRITVVARSVSPLHLHETSEVQKLKKGTRYVSA